MLFQAKNNAALAADLTQQRLTSLNELKGGKQESSPLPIGRSLLFDSGQLVAFVLRGRRRLSPRDDEQRPRRVVPGHGAGKHDSLGVLRRFSLHMRARVPLAQNDTMFAYLSPQFFQNLLSPRYQVELKRRLRSAVEMELLPIARLAAVRGARKPGGTIEELVASDRCRPRGLATRADGSPVWRPPTESSRECAARCTVAPSPPVPDVPLGKVTPAEEASATQGLSRQGYRAQLGGMAPIVARVSASRSPAARLERVIVDVQAAPLSRAARRTAVAVAGRTDRCSGQRLSQATRCRSKP